MWWNTGPATAVRECTVQLNSFIYIPTRMQMQTTACGSRPAAEAAPACAWNYSAKENKYSSVSWGRCRDDRKKEEKRGKINVIKLIENSFGINSSELGAIGNRVLGRSVLVFSLFFSVPWGSSVCLSMEQQKQKQKQRSRFERAGRWDLWRSTNVLFFVVFVVSVKSSQREQKWTCWRKSFWLGQQNRVKQWKSLIYRQQGDDIKFKESSVGFLQVLKAKNTKSLIKAESSQKKRDNLLHRHQSAVTSKTTRIHQVGLVGTHTYTHL